MEINRMIALYMGYCQSRQLRDKTMFAYKQSLKLFAHWLETNQQSKPPAKPVVCTVPSRQ